jgi:purine-binding chemotaxis protein CheW
MSDGNLFLLFCLNEARYAMNVSAVQRIVPAAEVTSLPDAADAVLGLINVAGDIMPVLDMRRRLGCPPRDMELSDRFILTHSAGRAVALLVDGVEGVVELSTRSAAHTLDTRSGSIDSVAALSDSIVLIQNIDAFASAAVLSHGVEPQRPESGDQLPVSSEQEHGDMDQGAADE